MYRFRRSAKFVSVFLTIFLLLIYMPVQSVFAAMVETEAVLGNAEVQSARAKVRMFLERQDVRDTLTAQGIDPLEAKARVNSLSDAEVQELAAKIDQLPAGGNFVGTLIIIIAVALLVLLITDMLGLTDIFTFINPPKK
jgi:hypothetical protein